MYSKKNLLAAIALGLSMSLTSAAPVLADETNVSVQVNVNQENKGIVSWEKGINAAVEVWGVGLPPVNADPHRATALARLAAKVDAYRQLAETVDGVQIDSETTMKDLAIESDVVQASVKALVKGARIVDEHANADGSYSVKMTIPVFGEASVASVAIPQVK